MSYFPTNSHCKRKVEVELNFSNYATKSEFALIKSSFGDAPRISYATITRRFIGECHILQLFPLNYIRYRLDKNYNIFQTTRCSHTMIFFKLID